MRSFLNKLKLILALVAFFICATMALDFPPIVKNAVDQVVTWRNYDYKLHTELKTWAQAEKVCGDWGGHLASILDEKENQLVELITDKTCWIGMNKVENQGYWEWIDRARSEFSSWLGGIIPSPSLDVCVIFNWNLLGMWGDVSCNRGFPFICKRPSEKCEWGNHVIGAPKPIVKTSFSNNELEIKVQMAEKFNADSVKYALGFNDLNLGENACQASSSQLLANQWTMEKKGCLRTYTLKMPLNEFMAFAEPQVSCPPGSDIIRMLGNLKMAYIDDSVENIPCIVTEFATDVEVKTILVGDSTVEFDFEGDGSGKNDTIIQPTFISLSNNDAGRLIIDVVITPSNPLGRFEDFDFFGHSAGIDFQCTSSEDCDTFGDFTLCKYRLTCTSSTSEDDYSGELKISTTYIENNKRRNAKLKFNLLYQLIEEPPAVENVIQTTAKLTQQDFTGQVDVLRPDERAYLLVETDRPIQINQAKFSLDDVYLCCTRNRQPLPPFDPSNGQLGCTVRDDNIMDFWAPLVEGGQVNDDMEAQVIDFGQFVQDKLGMTFKPNGIEGDDKLCYIHVKSALDLNAGKRSSQKGRYEKNAITAVTYKSCTSSTTKSTCTQSSLCAWNAEQRACVNKRLAQSSATKVASLVGIVASVFIAVLML